NFGFADLDLADAHSVTWALEPVSLGATPLGQFSVQLINDSTGSGHGLVHWSYDVDPSTWPGGSNHHEYFDVIVTDPYGAQTHQTVDIDYEALTGGGPGGGNGPQFFTIDAPGALSTIATDINDLGEIVGQAGGSPYRAFEWRGG